MMPGHPTLRRRSRPGGGALPCDRDKLANILKFLNGLSFRRTLNENGSRLLLKEE
jgi:hypothetical protein